MKKFLKIMACAMMVIAMVSVITSCKKEYKKQVVYKAGLVDTKFNSPDELGKVETYIKNCGALGNGEYMSYTITSNTSEDDCYAQADANAKSDFASATSNMNVEDAQALLLPGSYFSYIWFRTDDAGNVIEISRWECPAKPVPTEFGKLTVNGVDYIVTDAMKVASQHLGTPATSMSLIADDDVDIRIMISGLEQTGIVPSGDFNIDNEHNKFIVGVKDKDYHAKGVSCSISGDGGYYKFVSSGTATDENGNSVTYSLNCDKVVFTN